MTSFARNYVAIRDFSYLISPVTAGLIEVSYDWNRHTSADKSTHPF